MDYPRRHAQAGLYILCGSWGSPQPRSHLKVIPSAFIITSCQNCDPGDQCLPSPLNPTNSDVIAGNLQLRVQSQPGQYPQENYIIIRIFHMRGHDSGVLSDTRGLSWSSPSSDLYPWCSPRAQSRNVTRRISQYRGSIAI